MRINKLALVVCLGWAVIAQADENVMVDLSVLDSLGASYSSSPREPLFPVLPPKPKTSAPKKITKKQRPAKPQPRKPQAEVAAPVSPEPELEPVVVVDVEPVEPVVVVDVEPVAAEPTAPSSDVKPVEPTVAFSDATEANSSENISDAPASALLSPVAPAPKEEAVLPPRQELLVDTSEAESAPDLPRLVFADNVDELSPEQMAQIDDIIGRFKDINANKIAIYAYNLDDGIDSFKKKRLSLNRAVGVRSYLLKQGYKNFSIKVININSDSEKINTVELEEI